MKTHKAQHRNNQTDNVAVEGHAAKNKAPLLAQERIKQTTQARKFFVQFTSWVVSLWLVFVAVVILLHAFKESGLSNGVLITLLTTTTINILALSVVVMKGHFSED